MPPIAVAKIVRALVARLMFAVHGLIVIWRVASIYKDIRFWAFGICLILLFLEGAFLILQRDGRETRWFCLCVFLYLCATVPPIWFLQFDLCRKSIADLSRNETLKHEGETAILEFVEGIKFEFFIPLDREIWVQLLQQTMLLTLILGRWMLPKGDISRDHLSQLLLVFLAMAADMVELFDTFKENQVKYSVRLTTIVLAVWSVSLIQFPLVLTGKARKTRLGTLRNYSNQTLSRSTSRASSLFHTGPIEPDHSFCFVLLTDVNFWGVMMSTLLQDAPFLATRLYLLIAHQTISYIMIFFTCKNMLVVFLQCYRLMVVCCETRVEIENTRIIHALSQHKGEENCLVRAAMTTLMAIHDNELGQFQENFNKVETKINSKESNNGAKMHLAELEECNEAEFSIPNDDD